MARGLRGRIALAWVVALAGLLSAAGVALTAVGSATTGSLVAILGLAFVAGVLVAPAIAAVTAGPVLGGVRATIGAARHVADGQAPLPLTSRGTAEAEELTAAVNAMLRGLAARAQLVDLERERLEAVMQTMADGVILVDERERALRVNPAAAQLLGVKAAGAPTSLMDAVRDHELVELVRRSRDRGATLSQLLRVPATGREIQAIVTAVRDEAADHRLLLLRDLTELRQSELVRRDFVANVSHELRTPVTALKALVETLEGGAIADAEARAGFLTRMHLEVDRIAQLISELLDLARLEAGTAALQRHHVDLADTVRRAAERLRPQAERAQIKFDITESDEPVAAAVDPEHIGRVVVILVHNAIKFTPAGGRVRVEVVTRGGEPHIRVIDTGVGITPDDLPRLFERFYKTDPARAGGGTGLGLAIAKHTVMQHGGRIWAESAGPGRGSTFQVSLPGEATAPAAPDQ